MIYLQSFNGQKNLFDLVCFGLSFMILDIYSWITLPGRLAYPVATSTLTSFSEIKIANFAQITEADILWVQFH
jgi:hypothetical protein